jgi:hypothetical protein
VHSSPQRRAQWLLEAAAVGLFSAPADYVTRTESHAAYSSSGVFRHQKYLVRSGSVTDLPSMIRLEAECWPEAQRRDHSALHEALQSDGWSVLVAELDGLLEAALWCRTVATDEAIREQPGALPMGEHSTNGTITQLIRLNSQPESVSRCHVALGDVLRTFALQIAQALEHDRIVAITKQSALEFHTAAGSCC